MGRAQEITQGDDVYLPITVRIDEQPEAIAGNSTVEARLYDPAAGLVVGGVIPVDEAPSGSDWANGLIVLDLTSAITGVIEPGAYSVHVRITDAGGRIRSRHADSAVQIVRGWI